MRNWEKRLMGIPIDSNDIESMLNEYETHVDKTPAMSGSMRNRRAAKMDAVHEIRVRLRNLINSRINPEKEKTN